MQHSWHTTKLSMQLADVWRCSIASHCMNPQHPCTDLTSRRLWKKHPNHLGPRHSRGPSSSCRTVLLRLITDWMATITERLCWKPEVLRTQYGVHIHRGGFASSLPDTRAARACQPIRFVVYILVRSLYLGIHLPVRSTSCATRHSTRNLLPG